MAPISGEASSTMQPSSSKRPRPFWWQMSRKLAVDRHLAVEVGGEGDAPWARPGRATASLKENARARRRSSDRAGRGLPMVSRNSARSGTLRANRSLHGKAPTTNC